MKHLELLKKVLIVILVIAIVVAVHQCVAMYQRSRYDFDEFNCVQFTHEAIVYLKLFRIDSFQVVGWNTNDSYGHSWVGIDFFGTTLHYEPQNLWFFDAESKYEFIYENRLGE